MALEANRPRRVVVWGVAVLGVIVLEGNRPGGSVPEYTCSCQGGNHPDTHWNHVSSFGVNIACYICTVACA